MGDGQKINALYLGDCLDILKTMAAESVELIYLDPPFNSNANYTMLFGEGQGDGRRRVQAFTDTWSWQAEHENIYKYLIGGVFGNTAEGLRSILGACGMLAYLLFMMERLIEMRRVLKKNGSIYLHCDPAASHYLKIIMDAIFTHSNFLNEVVWAYGLGGSSKRFYSRKHDILLFYRKGKNHHFTKPTTGATSQKMSGMQKGMLDVWTDIPAINNMAKERSGYPTQKPLALLNRIIAASSREGDVVLDPFCGGGTTLAAAEGLGRNWIGIDISPLAIDTTLERLKRAHGKSILDKIELEGRPRAVGDVRGGVDAWGGN